MEQAVEKVRICHVNTRFLRGGGTKNTLLTLAGLDQARYEIDLVVGRDVYRPQVEETRGVNLVVVDSLVRNVHPLLDLRSLVALYRLFRRRRYHVVHTHLAKAGILGRLAARMAGVPIVVHSLHGVTFHGGLNPLLRWFYVFLERLAGGLTDCFVPVGVDVRDRYLARGIGRRSEYVVIHSGMDLDRFVAAGRMTAEQVQAKREELGIGPAAAIGLVGSLEPRKGHVYLLAAVAGLVRSHPAIRVLFVGEGFDRAELERAVQRYGLCEHVAFTGYREDVAEVIAALDVLVLPSLWEGLPQVLVQAAAVGRPVVTFDVEGAREVVKDGVNGFVVPLKDVGQLAARLDDLLSNPCLAKDMGERGKEFVDGSWSVQAMVRQTGALYERLLHERGSGPVASLGGSVETGTVSSSPSGRQ